MLPALNLVYGPSIVLQFSLNSHLRRSLASQIGFYFPLLLSKLRHVIELIFNVTNARQATLRSPEVQGHKIVLSV